MRYSNAKRSLAGISLVLSLTAIVGCSHNVMTTANNSKSDLITQTQPKTQAVTMNQLSQAQIKDLQYLCEEEKLARDVYAVLFDKWQIQAFSNIGSTENRHIISVQDLAKKYGVPLNDALAAGKFNNAELQQAYNDLTAKGLQSPEAALKVGAYIEELDINDINKMTNEALPTDIRQTFDWLNMGSRNHLRGFVRSMQNQSMTYQPQLLTQAEYEAIINSPQERGGQGQGGGHGQGQRHAY